VGLFESARAARRFFISNLKVEPGTVQKQLKKLLNGRIVGIVVTSVIMKISLMLM